MMHISVVIPVYNETNNLVPLYHELDRVLRSLGHEYELVFIDDGSNDGSDGRLRQLAASDSHVRVIRFGRNYGQTAALQAGLECARGDVIVTIDGDLQNDPADIPAMLACLEHGYDLVHGWRKNRRDGWLKRRLPSRIANWLIARVTGIPVHDLGCTLKVMRRDVADRLELYGQMHRFIPILAHQLGARCLELETNHRPRHTGQSKYGWARAMQVLLDIVTVRYMQRCFANPMKLFGMMGLGCGAAGAAALVATIGMKWWSGVDMTGNPLLLLAVLCTLMGVQLLSLGLLGETAARIYYSRQGHRPFHILEQIGPAPPSTQADRSRRRAA